MDFSPYQSRGNFAAPNQNYTDPLRVHADHSGGIALARESGRSGLNFWGAALQYKETVDSAKSMEANNEYNRLMSEGTALLMQKKQEQAVNIVDDYDKLHTKVLEQVQKKYKNYIGYGKAAVEFNNYTTRDNATRRSNMLKYQLAETDAFHETQFNNQLADCGRMVLDGGGTDDAIDGATARMESLVDNRYVNYGNAKKEEQKRILKNQLVSDALSLAVKMEDYTRMGDIMNKYGKSLDAKTYSAISGMVMKRNREERDLSNNTAMFRELGQDATYQQIRDWVKRNYYRDHPSENGNKYIGTDAEAWKEAQWVQAQTGLPAEYIYRQWAHESAYFSSQLARENNNFGGITQTEWNGDDNLQPDGNNYYREFNNFHEYAEAYVKDFINLYEGQEQVHDLASFAHFLKENGYYGAAEEDYLAAMENIDMEIEEGSFEEARKEPSGVEFEKAVDQAVAAYKKQVGIIKADENLFIDKYSLMQQDLINQGVVDPDAYDALALEAWEASGHSDRVRITLEKQGGHLRNIQRKQEEREAARASGTGGSGGSSGGNGRKTSDPFFKTKLEVMLRNGMSRDQAYQLIEETNPTDANSAVNLVNDYFAGKEKYSVDWDDYKQRIADVCGVNKSDGEFNVLYEQASDYAYELIMQYRDEHGGKDPTSAQITDYLIDGVTKTRIDTGERSWFGFGSPEYKESPLTPAEWFNRGVYNDPAEDYDADRGVYVVKTRRGTFTATEEQYQRIVDGEDADVVLSR